MAHETLSEHQLITDSSSALSLPNLLTQKKTIHFQAGDSPFESEDTLRYFYFIMSGKIKISQLNLETLKEQTIHLLTRGDMFDVVTLPDDADIENIDASGDNGVLEVIIPKLVKAKGTKSITVK